MDYQAEKQQEQKTIAAVASSVAKQLGWDCQPPKEDDRSCYIMSKDRRQQIHINFVWNHKERLSISGSFYQQQLQNFLPYKAENPEITVAISRGPEAIAKEITRRVLPGYTALLQKAQESKDREDAHRAKVNSNTKEILEVLAKHYKAGREHNDTLYFEGGEVHISADSAQVKLDLSVDQAKALLAMGFGKGGR